MIAEIYPKALRCGISCERFLTLSLREIADTVKTHISAVKEQTRQQQRRIYELAVLINRALLAPKTMPAFDELYPEDAGSSREDWQDVRERIRLEAKISNVRWGD